jgi:hypothetical protein
MRQIGIALLALLAACGYTKITDQYGNSYGGWYNPGEDYRWQLGVCQQEMESRNIMMPVRALAMRCCMRDHGVPIDDPEDCP